MSRVTSLLQLSTHGRLPRSMVGECGLTGFPGLSILTSCAYPSDGCSLTEDSPGCEDCFVSLMHWLLVVCLHRNAGPQSGVFTVPKVRIPHWPHLSEISCSQTESFSYSQYPHSGTYSSQPWSTPTPLQPETTYQPPYVRAANTLQLKPTTFFNPQCISRKKIWLNLKFLHCSHNFFQYFN